ncbi:mechanosensitive ion channel [Candidatus Roizmanbacteria bacterium]|nr:mechanosensitive ion channel [Candidatus Roizmanbacteria bacterium]
MLNFSTDYLNKLIFSVGILIATFIFAYFIKKSIDFVFIGMKKRLSNGYVLAKTQTIRSILKSISDVLLYLIAALIVIAHWGVNILPILTGAGILGLAFSFGAQTLVKDLIAGFFIIVENQFNIGDRIKVANFEGEVIRMTLRITVLRDKKGNDIYIPNSQITSLIRLNSTQISS